MGNCVADFAEKFCYFSRDFSWVLGFGFLFFFFFFNYFWRVLFLFLCLGSVGVLDGYCEFRLDYC